jgi:hypothetical protein
MKSDSLGNIKWNKFYGGGNGEKGYKIITTIDGNIIISGISYSFGNNSPYDNGQWYILKLDSSGQVIWSKLFGNPELRDYPPWGLTETIDSCYVISGSYTVGKTGSAELTRGCIIKLDKDGNLLWSKLYGKADPDSYTTIIKECKNSTDLIAIHNYGWNYPYVLSEHCPILERLDKDGNIKWFRWFYYTTSDYGQSVINSICITGDGGYLLGGYGVDYDSVPAQRSWLIKTDSLGFDGVSMFFLDTVSRIDFYADTCYGDSAKIECRIYGVSAPYVAEYYGYGIHSGIYYDNYYHPYAKDSLIVPLTGIDDTVLVISYRLSDGIGRTFYGTDTVFLPCYSGSTFADKDVEIHIYPNPNEGEFYVEYALPSSTVSDLEIYDIKGKKVYSEALKEEIGVVEIKPGLLPVGQYIVKIGAYKKKISVVK